MKHLIEEFIERANDENGLNAKMEELYINNGIKVYGFKFHEETEIPIVYNIDSAMEKFINHEIGLEDAYQEVAQIIKKADTVNKKINNVKLNKEYILKNVFFDTINLSRNMAILDNIPFTKVLDLANVFRVKLDMSIDSINTETISFIVDNNMMKKFSISLQELNENARMNMFKLYTPVFFPIYLSFELEQWNEYEHNYDNDVTNELYVLTFQETKYASGLLNAADKLEEISERLKSDIIIIPSSTNELLVFRKYSNWKELAIGLIEQKQYIPDELYLSNNVYEYKRGEKAVKIVREYLY